MKTKTKLCQLDENKICNNCKACLFCDLNPLKICDNCCECLDEADYRAIKIIGIVTDEAEAGKYRKIK